MSDFPVFTEESLKKIRDLMQSPVFSKSTRQHYVERLRNDVTADWISNFMESMQNRTESVKHTSVDTLVQDLRERVKLDSLKAKPEMPLSGHMIIEAQEKANKEDWEEIIRFVDDYLSSHRGYADTPAIIYSMRDKFGNGIFDKFGSRKIESLVEDMKSKFTREDVNSLLPSVYTGQPIKVEPGPESNTPMFGNIKLR